MLTLVEPSVLDAQVGWGRVSACTNLLEADLRAVFSALPTLSASCHVLQANGDVKLI